MSIHHLPSPRRGAGSDTYPRASGICPTCPPDCVDGRSPGRTRRYLSALHRRSPAPPTSSAGPLAAGAGVLCGVVGSAAVESSKVDSRWCVQAPEIAGGTGRAVYLSLIHISEPTRLGMISYAVFCLKKKKKKK